MTLIITRLLYLYFIPMENKLEQLLNSLIKKGRCVFWHRDRINAEKCNYIEWNYYNFDNSGISISLRELVSINSGLWQFVCENGMVKHEVYEDIQSWEHTTADHSAFWYTSWDNYEYRLIESALKDESELEDFLLQNIVIKDE